MNPIDALQFFSKVSTGMVLLMNLSLLISIRMALNWAKRTSMLDTSEEGALRWKAARRAFMVLILVVVGMNGAAVYANHRMTKATRAVAVEFPDMNSAVALNTR